MAAENAPINMMPIAITAVVAATILIGLKPIFDTYYTEMFEAEAFRKVGGAPPNGLIALHAAEAKGFGSAKVPLAKAMDSVVRDRSMSVIAPQQSTDTASLVGWAQLPKTGLGSLPPVPTPAPSASAASDGGAPPTDAAPAPATSASATPATPAATHSPAPSTTSSATHTAPSLPPAPPAPHP